ncbi:hypothetical protein [Cupriavidus gilardii]|uniref:hypothetical protein n=1 Tax=Cupriavidus gilardii TaxID=82541 RepID=UPI0021BE368F|nr:hypothetical protein [Cupriavidus gilardii]MCT9126106.1 hypothetical protein [Cupriavidus gilardii]
MHQNDASVRQPTEWGYFCGYCGEFAVFSLSTTCKPIHFVTAIRGSFPHNALTHCELCDGAASQRAQGALKKAQQQDVLPVSR